MSTILFKTLNPVACCRALLLLLLLLAGLSCQTMSPCYFEQLLPHKVRLLPEQDQLLLIDQSEARPIKHTHWVYLQSEYQRDSTFDTSEATTYLMQSLEQKLRAGGYFKRINRIGPLQQDLGSDELLRLGDSLQCDLILRLCQFELKSFMNTDESYVGHNILSAAEWELIEIPQLNILTDFVIYDTLNMGAIVLYEDDPFWSLPAFEQNLPKLTEMMAQKVYENLVPNWREAERFYFISGNYLIKLAVDRLRREDWDGAAAYWKQAYESGNRLNRYRAAFNLALYHDRLDRPVQALQWLEIAEECASGLFFNIDSFEKDLLHNWKILLRQRSIELESLPGYSPQKTEILPGTNASNASAQ